jgi:hypothetical protein
MPIDPVKIPQNVYIEDRIIGPLTLRQILIVCVGGGFSYALWASASRAYGYIGIPLTAILWLPAVFAIIIAFVKINDIGIIRLSFLMLERMIKPTVRMWAPRPGLTINIRTFSPEQDTKKPLPQKRMPSKLEELSSALDSAMQVEELEGGPTLPVNRNRVQVSQGDTPRVSIFTDLSPAPSHG